MRRRALLASFALPLLPPVLGWAPAQAQGNQAAALRRALDQLAAGRWTEADATAAPYPLVAKIIRWVQLTGSATPEAAAAFLTDNPDWPLPDTIRRRAEPQVAQWPEDARVIAWFMPRPPLTPQGKLRLAQAQAATGAGAAAAASARRIWLEAPSDPNFERQALDQLGPWLKPADHVARFDRLALRNDTAGARRLQPLLPATQALRAEAILTLLAGNDTAIDPRDGLGFLLRARLLRRQDQDGTLSAWWRSAPTPDDEELARALWNERQTFARRSLRLGDPAGAHAIAAAHGLSGGSEAALEAYFVAGWLALRFNDKPAEAAQHFARLSAQAVSPISVARGRYWQGRAAAALGQDPRAHYEAAATQPATYYGQLAVLALGEGPAGITRRIASLPQPMFQADQVAQFAARELARAAALLSEAGERGRARSFLLRIEMLAPSAADRRLAAALATALGRTDVAVEIARRTGPKDGTTLLAAGWPEPFEPPGSHRALALALMRQESNFDPNAVSPVGARGLMQLMPATAVITARKLGVPHTPAKLFEPAHNMALGTAYLAEQVGNFDGAVPLALAAYNAGPHRVRQWLAEAGDPRLPAAQGGADPIDWVERIPFTETRNYVQRVTESVAIYAARANETAQHPVLAMGR